jgi:hypothetical protein
MRGNHAAPIETVFPDGSYVGRLNTEGVPHGSGKMQFHDGTVYDGEWYHGKMNGRGVSFVGPSFYVSVFTTQYYFPFHCGQLCIYPESSGTYDGEWFCGQPHGLGKCVYANGSEYEGLWIKGKMEGSGRYKYQNGEEYIGEFSQNQPSGQGLFKYTSGNEYEGQFVKGQREGNGIFHYANGDSYAGEWRADKKEGIGIYKWKNGDKDIKTYANNMAGDGIRWNSDHNRCWRIVDGEITEEISVEEGINIQENFCLASPYLCYVMF